MSCTLIHPCRTFHTAPEQGQGPTPIVPIVLILVLVPVLVPDTASVITLLTVCVNRCVNRPQQQNINRQ